jgi:hypothetical protein
MIIISCVAIIAIAALSIGMTCQQVKQNSLFERERDSWKQERQMLLDRIQAPSFAEYTSKVVKEIKAAKPEEEKDKQDYIS